MPDYVLPLAILLAWLPLLSDGICSQPPPQPPGYPDDLSGLRVVSDPSWAVEEQASYACPGKREVKDRPYLSATCVATNR